MERHNFFQRILPAAASALLACLLVYFFRLSPDVNAPLVSLTRLLWLRTALAAGIALGAGLLFWTAVIRHPQLAENFRNAASVLLSLILLGLCLETVFMHVPQSHGADYTLAQKVWFSRYWRTNALGYRDEEIHRGDASRRKMICVGDSFTAGAGVKAGERYSDLLQQRFSGWRVFNLGQRGADTLAEYSALTAFPFKPNLLILQYYGNDMEGVGKLHGKLRGALTPYVEWPPIFRALIKKSFFLNYLYWRFPHADMQAYGRSEYAYYRDPDLFQEHLRALEQFVTYAKERRVPLIVVIFPFLAEELPSPYVPRIRDFFLSRNVPVVDVSTLVAGMPVRQRIANFHDAHPSARVHALVAQALEERIKPLLAQASPSG